MRRQVYQPLAPGQAPRPMAYSAQGQVFYSNQYVQQQQQQPHVITLQTHPQSGAMYHHGQVFNSGNPMGTGVSWLSPGYGQNIMVVQSPTQSQSSMLPLVVSPYRPNSVAPQTAVSNASTNNYNSPPAWTQIRPRRRLSVPPTITTLLPQIPSYSSWSTAENETQTNESFSQVQPQLQIQPASHEKSDASSQAKPSDAESKEETAETNTVPESESFGGELETNQLPQQLTLNFQTIMASSPEITPATVSSSSSVNFSVDMATDTEVTTSATSIVSSTVPPMTASAPPVMTSTETSTSSSSLHEGSDIVTADSASMPDATKEVVSEELPSTETFKPPSPLNLLDDIDIKDSDIVESVKMKTIETAEVLHTHSTKEEQFEIQNKELFQPSEKYLAIKEKQPPKAIVKPQVLTHVIGGFVIAETPENFLPSKSSLSHTEYQEVSSGKPKMFQAPSPKKLKMYSCRGRSKRGGRRGRRGRPPKIQNLTEDMDVKEAEVASVEVPVPESQKIEESPIVVLDPLPVSETSVSVKMEEEADVVSEINPTKKLPTEWGVDEVFEFIKEFPGCSDYAETFRSQEIDGQSLLLLKVDHLMTAMSMKLGPALKLIAHLNSIKEELSLQAQT